MNLSLTGPGVTIDRATATLTIRDNDFNTLAPPVLLNELYINDPGNDGGHEFIELSGTPGANLGSLYLAVVDGNVGGTEGRTTLVIDLGPYSLGSSGLAIIQAQDTFDFRVPDGVTQIKTPLLNTENLTNDTATFFLLASPMTNLATSTIDYDWDNDGSLELPTGIVTIDSIANKDNGVLDQTYGPAANRIDSNSNPNSVRARRNQPQTGKYDAQQCFGLVPRRLDCLRRRSAGVYHGELGRPAITGHCRDAGTSQHRHTGTKPVGFAYGRYSESARGHGDAHLQWPGEPPARRR